MFQTLLGMAGPRCLVHSQNVSVRWASGVRAGATFPKEALSLMEEMTGGLGIQVPLARPLSLAPALPEPTRGPYVVPAPVLSFCPFVSLVAVVQVWEQVARVLAH